MLQPGPLWSTFNDDPYWANDWFGAEAGRYNRLEVSVGAGLASELTEQQRSDLGSNPIIFQVDREEDSAPLAGLGAIDTHLMDFDIDAAFASGSEPGLCWVGRSSRILAANEGYSLKIMPSGSMSDSPHAYFGVAFGTEWFLSFHGQGFAWLWRRVRSGATHYWTHTQRLEYQSGSFDAALPFQCTVIPWGPDRLSFVFSQTRPRQDNSASDTSNEVRSGFMVEMKRLGLTPEYNASINQYVKTSPARIYLAVRKTVQQVYFGLAAVRYVATGVRLAPEWLPEPMPHASPVCAFYGRHMQRDSSGQPARFFKDPAMTIPGIGFENDLGGAWNPATDTRLAMFTYLKPSGNGIYTPEMAGITAKVDPLIETMPDEAEEDVSADVRRLSLSLTRDMAPTHAEILVNRKVHEDGVMHEHYKRLLQSGGTLRITAKGAGEEGADVILFDGSIVARRPTIQGAVKTRGEAEEMEQSLLMTDDMLAVSRWQEFMRTSAAGVQTLARQTVGAILRTCFLRAGFGTSEYWIDPDLESIQIDSEEDGGDDWKLPNDSCTVGHVLHGLQEFVGRQGQRRLLVMPVDGVMRCRLETYYEPGGQIDWAMVLSKDVEEDAGTDEERWVGNQLRLYDNQLEVNVDLPRYNSMTAFAATRTGQGAEAYAVFIAPDPAVFDPTSIGHQNRASHFIADTPRTGFASTLNGLARFARKVYDEECTCRPRVVVIGEWQPGVWPDQIVAILGQAPADTEDIAVGEPVSYGAWRIEEIKPDITCDDPNVEPGPLADGSTSIRSRRFTFTATYTLEWAGATDIDGYPMWAPESYWPK